MVVVLRQTVSGQTATNLETDRMAAICKKYPVEIVFAVDPPDMKASVIEGIRFLQKTFSPREIDGCFLAPADIPTLTCGLIDQLLNVETNPEQPVQPVFGNQKGHPVRIPWQKLTQVFDLKFEQGIDVIVKKNVPLEIHLPAELQVTDIDTMHEYQRILKQYLAR